MKKKPAQIPTKPESYDILNNTITLLVRLVFATYRKHGPFPSLGERGWKLLEELDELKFELNQKDPNYAKIRDEALDVANVAMTIATEAAKKLEAKKTWK